MTVRIVMLIIPFFHCAHFFFSNIKINFSPLYTATLPLTCICTLLHADSPLTCS